MVHPPVFTTPSFPVASSGNKCQRQIAFPRWSFFARVIAKSVEIKLVVFGRAYVFVFLDMRILQPKRHLQGVKGLTIHDRITDRLRPFQSVVVQAPECFRYVSLITERPARIIEPNAVFGHGSNRLDLEGVIVQPFAHGVAHPARFPKLAVYFYAAIHQFGERTTVGPNDAPSVVVVIQKRDLGLVLKDLGKSEAVMIPAGESERLAEIPGIIVLDR